MSDEPHSKTLLLAFIRSVKAHADEIGEIQEQISDVVKEAKGAGFDGTKIREVVSWLRKIDKHGRDKVDEAEAIFDLYRTAVDGGATKLDEMMSDARDRALLAIFAPTDQVDKKLNQRRKNMKTALAMAAAAKAARQS